MNFGKDVSTLKYFTICGLQEGYEPFAVNMNRDLTMWISKRLPQFIPVPLNHEHIEVRGHATRVLWVERRCTERSQDSVCVAGHADRRDGGEPAVPKGHPEVVRLTEQ